MHRPAQLPGFAFAIQLARNRQRFRIYFDYRIHRRTFPIHPLAITNPIRVDLEGDGFDPPGIPAWVEDPADGGD